MFRQYTIVDFTKNGNISLDIREGNITAQYFQTQHPKTPYI